VSNAYSTLRKHWVIDAATGAVVATSPVATHVVVTEQFAYAAGDRSGTTADADEWSVSRMNPDGSMEEELFVGTDDDQVWTVAASANEAFIVRYIDSAPMNAELWRATDGAPGIELLLDFGGPWPSPFAFAHDGERLLFQQKESEAEPLPPVVALDLATLTPQPLFVPPEPARALFPTSTELIVGTAEGVYRTDKEGQGLELLHDTDGAVVTIAGDDVMVFWLVAGPGLYAWDPVLEVVEEIAVTAGIETGYGELGHVALTPDALYLLHYGHSDMTTEHSGSVWRLWRP
jgi:hypothetical protein